MAMSGNPFSMGGNTPFGTIVAGLPGVAQGLFGNSGRPYKKAFNAFLPYFQQSQAFQAPFFQTGAGALGLNQQYLNKMQDPSSFINSLMNNYQESPWAKFQTDQALRANNHMASAAGLIGSTPWQQAGEQYARDISSQDMNTWLQNVLGINTQYGQGIQNEVNMGQHAGDILSELFNQGGQMAGQAAYGQEAGRQQDRNAFIGGIAKMFGG